MTIKQVEEKLTELKHREPFVPFVVELIDGKSLMMAGPNIAFDNFGAVWINSDDEFVEFEFKNVRAIRFFSLEAIA